MLCIYVKFKKEYWEIIFNQNILVYGINMIIIIFFYNFGLFGWEPKKCYNNWATVYPKKKSKLGVSNAFKIGFLDDYQMDIQFS